MEHTYNTLQENSIVKRLIWICIILGVLFIVSLIFNILQMINNSQWKGALANNTITTNKNSTYVPTIQNNSQLQSAQSLLNSISIGGTLQGGISQNASAASTF